MREEEAREWIEARYGVSRGTLLERFAECVIAENERHNLISRSSVSAIWVRHLLDSAQLLAMTIDGDWIDIGTGAGFPGMVIALLEDRVVTLIEPRRRRAEFLANAAEMLGVANRVTVVATRVETFAGTAAVISARAIASVLEILTRAQHCSTPDTRWLLPKGRHAPAEVELARRSWHGSFRMQPSVTEEESLIVIADRVRPR